VTPIDPASKAPQDQDPSHVPSPEPSAADRPAEPLPDEAAQSRRILIGSQRDPAAYRVRRTRDWTPVIDESRRPQDKNPRGEAADPPATIAPTAEAAAGSEKVETITADTAEAGAPAAPLKTAEPETLELPALMDEFEMAEELPEVPSTPPATAPRGRMGSQSHDDFERAFQEAIGGTSLDDLMAVEDAVAKQVELEPDSHHTGTVAAIRRDEVFVALGGREQGCLKLQDFAEPPKIGSTLEVVVRKLNREDGLYELGLPDAAVDVSNWDDVREGMLVQAQITGHNSGGLECEVNHLRGFIPVSQVALYRVEDLSEFVGQHWPCLVTDCNPMRKNLVLSRRAVLEREKEEVRQRFLDALAPGQIYEGTVRKLMDFGAFVDIGGADGLLHVSQLAWGRVNHPSEVLSEGQAIRVWIEKYDRETGKISLGYRDMLENPWATAVATYPTNSVVKGRVTKIMEFGAFVELERGIEGLVHISELSHKRVWRASDVVQEGQEVEVLVLSVNAEAQRMSLSIRALSKPEPTKEEKEAAAADQPAEPVPAKRRPGPDRPLKGGLGKPSGGDRFGLKW
jgi:predicted RNA-binding protein with RPS1 domain